MMIKTSSTGIYYKLIGSTKSEKVYYITYKDLDRKKIWLKVGTPKDGYNISKCKLMRDDILVKMRVGDDLPKIVQNRQKRNLIILDKLAEHYFKDKEKTVKTNAKSKSRYEHITAPHIGKNKAELIKQKDITKLQNIFIELGKSPATTNWLIQQIGAIYNHGIKKGLVKENPCTGIEYLKLDNARERFLTLEEIKTLYKNIKDDKELLLFTKLSLTTGGRLETIMHIYKKDIDFTNKTITLHDLKNQSTYKGFFGDSLSVMIEEHIKDLNPNDKIIKTPSRTIRRKMKNVLDRLFNQGLDVKDTKNRVVTHTLRHSFASNLAIQGTPILTIQKLMNHRDIKQTMRYAKLSPESGKNAVIGLFE